MAIDKTFESDADRFLRELDQLHPEKSESQLREINKYNRINALRDKESQVGPTNTLWEDF